MIGMLIGMCFLRHLWALRGADTMMASVTVWSSSGALVTMLMTVALVTIVSLMLVTVRLMSVVTMTMRVSMLARAVKGLIRALRTLRAIHV